jgi:hypothetical protein
MVCIKGDLYDSNDQSQGQNVAEVLQEAERGDSWGLSSDGTVKCVFQVLSTGNKPACPAHSNPCRCR